MYDWMWTRLPEVLLTANEIDEVIQVIPWYGDDAGVVHGLKDNIHVSFTVFKDEDENWVYEKN